MAKQPCVICGKLLGFWSEKSITSERQLMCKKCALKCNYHFSLCKHTLAEYYEHLQQVEESNRIYEALFKPRINLKQDYEGWRKVLKKNNTDEKVKRYSGSLWAVEDFGLILFNHGQQVKKGEDGERNLVFRYSDLVSYSYSREHLTADSENLSDLIHLTFNDSYLVHEITVSLGDKVVYTAFDNYFSGIVNGDKQQWDTLADAALARAGITTGTIARK